MSSESTPPLTEAPVDPRATRYRMLLTASGLEGRLGHAGLSTALSNRANRYATNQGLDTAGLSGEDFNSPDFSLTNATQTRGIINRVRQNRGQDVPIHAGQFNDQVKQIQSENLSKQGQDIFQNQVDPALGQAQGIAQGLASTPLYGAQFMANERSRIAATVKSSEEDRLRRVSAVLGLGSMDPSSPSGASMALRTSLESDAEMSRALTNLEQSASQGNRDAAGASATLLSQLATTRESARRAAQSGDLERLYSINNDLSTILEAVRSQYELRQYQNSQARQAGFQWGPALAQAGLHAVGSLPGLAASAMTGGAAAAAGAGGVGAGNVAGVGIGNSHYNGSLADAKNYY